jgi:DNA helicase HerA-like ATPase
MRAARGRRYRNPEGDDMDPLIRQLSEIFDKLAAAWNDDPLGFIGLVLVILFVIGMFYMVGRAGKDMSDAMDEAMRATPKDGSLNAMQQLFAKSLGVPVTPQVTVVGKRVVTWAPRPGKAALQMFIAQGGQGHVEAKLNEVLTANPKSDLDVVAEALSIKIFGPEDLDDQDEEAAEVEIGNFVNQPGAPAATISYDDRNENVYICGVPKMGKSTLLMNMARQDITNKKGVVLLDPHQEIVDDLRAHIPATRRDDVVLFDHEHLWGIDYFDFENEQEKERIVRDAITAFSRLSQDFGPWGQGMDDILANSLLSLILVEEASFPNAYKLLTDDAYRKKVIVRLQNEDLDRYWTQEFPKVAIASKQAVTKRLRLFVTNETLKSVFSGELESLNLRQIVTRSKILLVKLTDDDVGHVIGSFIVSKIEQLALRRKRGARVPLFLYLDEFQTFTSADFQKIYAQGRKFNLCMTVANQGPKDLDEQTRRAMWKSQIYVIFRQDHENAPLFRDALGEYDRMDLQNLPKFHAIFRKGETSTAKLIKTLPPPEKDEDEPMEVILASSARKRKQDEPADDFDDDVRPSQEPS